MALNKKPSLEENRITESGWTFPESVVGELPPQRPESDSDVAAMIAECWARSADRWKGPRFAVLTEDGQWTTGQIDLFDSGKAHRPEGSWPKQIFLTPEGEVLDVRPWIPRPPIENTLPTPVSYDATPGGPGNHYKGLGHQAKHGGEIFSTPTASTSTGADMVQALFSGDDPARPKYDEATRIFSEGKPGIWRTPSARDFKGADPKNATKRQIGLNDQVKAQGMVPSPNAHGGLYGGQGSRQIMMRRVAAGEITMEEAEAMLGATGFPTDTGRAHIPGLLPTPTGTERAGTNPNTGKGGGLSRIVKDQAGLVPTPRANDAEKRGQVDPDNPRNGLVGFALGHPGMFPTPRAGKTSGETEESWLARQAKGDVSTPPLDLAVRMQPKGNWRSPTASDAHPRRKSENWEGNDLVSRVTEIEEAGGAIVPQRGGQLNPDWVDVLMGYRVGTTILEPEAEDWFKIDARRLKASDLKKLHALDEADPDVLEGEDVEAEE